MNAMAKRMAMGDALSTLERAARELHESGTLGFLDGALGYAEVQQLFG